METQKTILVVDDEKELCDVLREKLEREGFKVITANDGAAALSLAREWKPDLTLLDIIMPKVDGLAVLEELRKDEWGKTANIMLLTVLDDPESISKAMSMGSFEYFVKTDWKIDDVVRRVKEKLSS